MKNIILLLFILISTGFFNILAQNAPNKCVIIGKIVDSEGKPVKEAGVHYFAGDNIILFTRSREDGSFEVTSNSTDLRFTIWVTSEINWNNWVIPVSPGNNLTADVAANFKGLEFVLDKQQKTTNVGEIPIQIYYGKISVLIKEKDSKKVFQEGLLLRVRSPQGDIVAESSLKKGINKNDSSINIALPYGTWSLEIKNANMDWHLLADKIILSHAEPVQLNFSSKDNEILNSPKVKTLLKFNTTDSLAELEKRGLSFTIDDFQKKINSGNIEAVILYLRAGMNPNTRFERGFTPLIFAVEYPEIIKILLRAGANVNLKSYKYKSVNNSQEEERLYSEETALLWAVYKGNFETVQLLLGNGAIADDTNSYGDTALIKAVEGGEIEIIKELLKYGANPHIKNFEGKSPLDIANENSNKEIIQLLQAQKNLR